MQQTNDERKFRLPPSIRTSQCDDIVVSITQVLPIVEKFSNSIIRVSVF